MSNIDIDSTSKISLSGGLSSGLSIGQAQAEGSYSKDWKFNEKFNNVIRKISGHNLDKMKDGPIDITTGALEIQ